MRFIDDALDFIVFIVMLGIVLSVALPKVIPAIYESKDDIAFIDKSSPSYLGYGIESDYDGEVSLLDTYMMVQVQDGGIPDVSGFRLATPSGRLYAITDTYNSEFNIGRVRDEILPDINYLAGYYKLYSAWKTVNPDKSDNEFDILAECRRINGVATDCSSSVVTTLDDKKAVNLAITYNGGTLTGAGTEKLTRGTANDYTFGGVMVDFRDWYFNTTTVGTSTYAIRDYISNGSGGYRGWEGREHLVEPVVGIGPIRVGTDNANSSATSFGIVSAKGVPNKPYIGSFTHKVPLERNSSYLFSADMYCQYCSGMVELFIITEGDTSIPLSVGGVQHSVADGTPTVKKVEKKFTTNSEALTLEIIFTKTDSGDAVGADVQEAFVFDNVSLLKVPNSDPHYEIRAKVGGN